MPEYEVRATGKIDATVTVEADNEEDALAAVEARGLERDDYFEIEDVQAISAKVSR